MLPTSKRSDSLGQRVKRSDSQTVKLLVTRGGAAALEYPGREAEEVLSGALNMEVQRG